MWPLLPPANNSESDMLKPRQQRILEWLEQAGAATYQELAQHLGTSTMTVRRAVDELNERGLIIKTVGGVQWAKAPAYLMESVVRGRMAQHRREKQSIARCAIPLLDGVETLALDGSTTCLEFAKLIARRIRGMTAITYSALTALELGRSHNNTVISLGGEFDPDSCCFVGTVAENAAEQYYVDVAVISTMGFLPAEGTFESAVANFRVKQVLARRAKKVVLLVDHSKFGRRALVRVLDLDEIHCVVTDRMTSAEHIDGLTAAGIEVRRADDSGDAGNGAIDLARQGISPAAQAGSISRTASEAEAFMAATRPT
jgi:DeoR/GlpR family transcriptional regulator of sugar metabolism